MFLAGAAISRRSVAAALVLAFAGTTNVALAQAGGLNFELINPPSSRQVGVVLRVRIADAQGGPIPSARISSARLDRTSDLIGSGVAPVTLTPDGEYGVYGFRTDVNTDGAYTLSFVVEPRPGDPPVQGQVTFTLQRPRSAR